MEDSIEIRPLTPGFGAEVLGVDLSQDLSNAQFASIRQAFHDHSVIFFRDQVLAPEDHIAFAKRWGAINVNRFFRAVDGYPEIAEVLKEPDQTKNIGSDWHTDHSYDAIPALGSALYAKEVPESGGDTLFASMHKAYDALSDGMKEMLDGMKAWHSSRHVFGAERHEIQDPESDYGDRLGNSAAATQDALHPVIIRHPDTGRKALYVNSTFTVRFDGWTEEESQPLLNYLYRHGQRPEFTCRFQWREGSLALWDNRATWHFAINDYHGERRYMQRITIEGVPIGA